MSSGPNRPRKTSGCTSEKTTLNGSRTSGRDSRANTVAVSCTNPVGRADAAGRSFAATVGAAGLIVFMMRSFQICWTFRFECRKFGATRRPTTGVPDAAAACLPAFRRVRGGAV